MVVRINQAPSLLLGIGVRMIMILAIGTVLEAIQPPLLMLVLQRWAAIRIPAVLQAGDVIPLAELLINGILIM